MGFLVISMLPRLSYSSASLSRPGSIHAALAGHDQKNFLRFLYLLTNDGLYHYNIYQFTRHSSLND